MPELTHDADDGFHEIQLSGKQLVFLFMATTVISVVIFLCGVLVGRGVRAERGGEDPTVAAAAPVAAPPVEAAPQAAEPPPPPREDALSYHTRLQGNKPPAEELKKAAEPLAVAPPTAVENAVSVPGSRTRQAPASAGVTKTGDVPTNRRAGNWIIQVHALQNRDAANAFVRSLTTKGYPAFLLNPSPGSPQIYRVQIGAYADRGEAEKIADRLEKEEQFKPAIKRR